MHSSNLDIKYELKHSCPSANYTSSIEHQVDAYMYEGEQGLGMVRAGSAAIKLRKRQQHTKPQVVEGSFGLCTGSIDCLFFFDLKYLFFVGCRDSLHDTDYQDRNGYPYGNVGRYRDTSKRWTCAS